MRPLQIERFYDGDALAPSFEPVIRRSLTPESAYAFLKSVDLPVTDRDFLLSKLFQFLYVPLEIQGQLDQSGALPLRRTQGAGEQLAGRGGMG